LVSVGCSVGRLVGWPRTPPANDTSLQRTPTAQPPVDPHQPRPFPPPPKKSKQTHLVRRRRPQLVVFSLVDILRHFVLMQPLPLLVIRAAAAAAAAAAAPAAAAAALAALFGALFAAGGLVIRAPEIVVIVVWVDGWVAVGLVIR
jgi:hypothetical protein